MFVIFRRQLLIVSFCFLFLVSVTACSDDKPKLTASASEITNTIIRDTGMENMVVLEKDQISNHYSFDTSYLSDFSVYISSQNDVADEVAVFIVNEENQAEAVKKAVDDRLRMKATSFKEMSNVDYQKIENGIIKHYDKYIILIIAPDNNLANSSLSTFY